MVLEFLKEFSQLSPVQQKVFLYCLEKKPFLQAGTDDLSIISAALGISYKSVWLAMHAISALPTLSKVVQYIHSDIKTPSIVSLDAIFRWEAVSEAEGWSKPEI
jgi:hypothetical protein